MLAPFNMAGGAPSTGAAGGVGTKVRWSAAAWSVSSLRRDDMRPYSWRCLSRSCCMAACSSLCRASWPTSTVAAYDGADDEEVIEVCTRTCTGVSMRGCPTAINSRFSKVKTCRIGTHPIQHVAALALSFELSVVVGVQDGQHSQRRERVPELGQGLLLVASDGLVHLGQRPFDLRHALSAPPKRNPNPTACVRKTVSGHALAGGGGVLDGKVGHVGIARRAERLQRRKGASGPAQLHQGLHVLAFAERETEVATAERGLEGKDPSGRDPTW